MFQCIHKNTRYICKICNDKNNKYCKHGKLKWLCIICENQPCIHKIIKKNCEKCKSKAICKHMNITSNCKECKLDKKISNLHKQYKEFLIEIQSISSMFQHAPPSL